MTAPRLEPPCPIWRDDELGVSIFVNGGYVEINVGDNRSLAPAEATRLMRNMSAAVAEANLWAARWDTSTRTYREDRPVPVTPSPGAGLSESSVR